MTQRRTYLGNAFDNYQNLMQIARCIREASRQLGIDSPSVLELSRHKTNLEEYLPEGSVTRFATHDRSEEPSLGDPVRIPFDDRSFDVSLVTDAYEHIPQEMRVTQVLCAAYVLCSCSGWRAMEAARDIERRTGRVTITTNMATLWRTLKKVDIHEARPGIGRLLGEMPPIEDPVQAPAA